MAKKQAKTECTVRDGLFVEPCDALQAAWEGPGRTKGVRFVHLSNMKTGKPTRSFAVLHSGDHVKRGLAMNYCPFCGARIDAPFTEDVARAS